MVSTRLKNISQSQNGSFPQIGVKMQNCLKPPPSSGLSRLRLGFLKPSVAGHFGILGKEGMQHFKTTKKVMLLKHPPKQGTSNLANLLGDADGGIVGCFEVQSLCFKPRQFQISKTLNKNRTTTTSATLLHENLW